MSYVLVDTHFLHYKSKEHFEKKIPKGIFFLSYKWEQEFALVIAKNSGGLKFEAFNLTVLLKWCPYGYKNIEVLLY